MANIEDHDKYFLDHMTKLGKNAIKSAGACKIDDTLHDMQRTGILAQSSLLHEEVSILGGRDIQDEYDAIRKEVDSALRKGCKITIK